MRDLHLERFLKNEPGDGPMKTFGLRGIKDSPPYLHDGRCFTLEDTVIQHRPTTPGLAIGKRVTWWPSCAPSSRHRDVVRRKPWYTSPKAGPHASGVLTRKESVTKSAMSCVRSKAPL